MRYSVIHQRPGLHCSSSVYDVRTRISWTALRSPHLFAGEVCWACSFGARAATASDPHTNKTAGPPGGKNSIQPSMDLSRVPSLLKAPSPAGCGGIGACCASSGTSPTPHWRRSLQTSSLFVPWLWLGRGLDLAVLRLLGDGSPGPTDQVRRQASPAMTRGGR